MAKTPIRIGDIISEEDALPPISPASDYLNRPLTLHSFEWKDGDKTQYALMTVTIDQPDPTRGETEEEIQISCGAQTVVTQLKAIDQLSHLPLPIQIVKHKESRMLKLI